ENVQQEGVNDGGFKLLVVSSASDSVEVYDYQKRKTITTISVGKNPRDIILSHDKELAFVNNMGEGAISVIDVENFKVASTLQVGEKPWDMVISPDDKFLYVSNQGGGSVSVINVKELRVVSTVKVGTAPTAMTFATEGKKVFVSNSGSSDVTVIDTATLKAIATIPVGPRPEHVINNGDYVFVINQGDNTISVIHVDLLDIPVGTFGADDIADCGPVVSDQDFTYTTIPDKNLVLKLWVEDMSLEAEIPVGERPYQFSFSPDNQIGFVTNSGSDDISVLNLTASRVIENLPVGKGPMGLAVV
ncbi:MAG: beta-propeller fold lactonase family protein, partial [Candidatus Hydrothermarchaeaceae archaeon]